LSHKKAQYFCGCLRLAGVRFAAESLDFILDGGNVFELRVLF
jgi:hypothetical protein